jgi:hypothetical protein
VAGGITHRATRGWAGSGAGWLLEECR